MELFSYIFVPVVFVIMGIVLISIGIYLFWSQKIEIINTVDLSKTYNRVGLSKYAGKNLIFMGSIIIFISVINILIIIITNQRFFLYNLIAIMGTLLYFSIKVTLKIKKFEI